MRRVALSLSTLLAVGVGMPNLAFADGSLPASSSSDADFVSLVKQGDQARIAGKWSAALRAYAAALELRDDPLVAGRLGLVLVEFREYDAAAGKLFQAIEQGAGANDAERTRFFQAFLVAKKETCRLDVVVMQNGVKLELDGEPRFGNRREFWAFVRAGKHKLKATLEGFEDETIDMDAPKGGQLNITISLHPVKPKDEAVVQPDPSSTPLAPERSKSEVKPAAVVVEDEPANPTNPSPTNPSFVAGIGFGVVLGATPTPAVGPNLFGAWRSRSWWEVSLDGRVAWTFLTDERAPRTQFVTWSAMVVPCGRWWKRRVLTCGLLQLDGTQRTDGTEGGLLPGIGLRGGVEFETHRHVAVQVVGDIAFHYRGFTFQFPETNDAWTGPILTGTLGLRAVIKP